MGLYMNTLPARLNLDGTGVEDSVRQTHTMLADLLGHEHSSLAVAQRCSGVTPGVPLFSALLNYRHNTVTSVANTHHALEGMQELGGDERTNYPLVLSIEDSGSTLGLTAQVVDVLSPLRVCELMERALTQLADALEHAPSTPVRSLDVLPLDERTLLLETWNDTARPYPRDTCVHELFERWVDRRPDAVAVVVGEQSLTYAELDVRANQLAHHLRTLGVGPDVLVGICVERSFEMVIGLLGILKAGGGYLPLDPGYPTERLAFMMEDAAVTVLVTQQRLAAGLPSHRAHIVCLDTDAGMLSRAHATRHPSGASAEHIAYVDFTSGSTGRPKGACIPHRAVARLVLDADFLEIHPDDVFLQMSPIAFDASTLELWGPLLNGAKLVLLRHTRRRSKSSAA